MALEIRTRQTQNQRDLIQAGRHEGKSYRNDVPLLGWLEKHIFASGRVTFVGQGKGKSMQIWFVTVVIVGCLVLCCDVTECAGEWKGGRYWLIKPFRKEPRFLVGP